MLGVLGEQFEDSYFAIRTFSKDIRESASAINCELEFPIRGENHRYVNVCEYLLKKLLLLGDKSR